MPSRSSAAAGLTAFSGSDVVRRRGGAPGRTLLAPGVAAGPAVLAAAGGRGPPRPQPVPARRPAAAVARLESAPAYPVDVSERLKEALCALTDG